MRRGFTLVEVLIGLVLTMLVGGVIYQLLNNNQRVTRGQLAQTSMQDNVRSGALVIGNELREIGYDSIPTSVGLIGSVNTANPDLITMLPGRIRYKATRGTGFTCAAPTATQVKLKKSTYIGVQTPVQDDSIALYVEGSSSTVGDDAWVHAGVTAVVSGTCLDGSAAWVLTVGYPGAYTNIGAVLGTVVQGGPVRVLEVMEMRYYSSAGRMWLGMQSLAPAGGGMEPVVGPLSDSTVAGVRGLTFEYLNTANGTALLAKDVRTVRLTLQGISAEQVRRSGAPKALTDSLLLVSRVALRNTLRP
jgi:prepilin-type N-terminal cleavage/methylation domain-containing protein